MTHMETEKIVEEFFKERFPENDIEFEKRCGYFYEWVARFESYDPTRYMDSDSKLAWKRVKQKLKIK